MRSATSCISHLGVDVAPHIPTDSAPGNHAGSISAASSTVCVRAFALRLLNMTQSAISHQLRILKQNKLVKSRREGKSIFYSLADGHVSTIIAQGRDHIEEDA